MNMNSIMELFIFLTVLQTIPVISNFTRPAEGFTAEGIKGILDTHNEIRSQLALGNFSTKGKLYPSAARMLKVKWDPEVAAIAQAYVDTWNGSDENKGIASKGYPGLVEVHFYDAEYDYHRWNNSAYQLLGAAAVRSWFNPYIQYGFTNFLKYFGEAVFLMDQISGVGCGIVEKTGRIENGTLKPYVCALVLCYFAPRQFIYKEGKTCSECPDGTKCEESTGLCEDIEKEAPFNGSAAGLSAEGVNKIVDIVNKYRSQIALGNVSVNGTFWPSATNMMKVNWDPELAAIAQGDVNYPGLARSSIQYDWKVQMTDSEYKEFGSFALTSFFDIVTGKGFKNVLFDFENTQFIMADTSGIGCVVETVADIHHYFLKCQLTPRRFMYKEGETCSECPSGTKCEEPTGLCKEDPSSSDATKNISFGLYFLYFLTFYRIHLL